MDLSQNETIRRVADIDRLVEDCTRVGDDKSNEENGLSYAMQMQLGRRPTKKINKSLEL